MKAKKKDIKFWNTVLTNLSNHTDKPFVNELIENVKKNIEKLKESS